VLLKGLTSERLSHRGPYFQYFNVPMELRPLQQPHPPLWYGIGTGGSLEWLVEHAVNTVSNAPCAAIAPILRRYRERWQTVRGAAPPPKLGIARHLFVAETDTEAEKIAAPAYAAWFDSFARAWRDFGANPVRYPPGFDAARKMDVIIAGSPATVRSEIERQIAAAGVNYFVCRFAYGNLTHAQSASSLELFVSEVMSKVVPPATAAVA
jgi:alkanesulfonate monooxygenase SsuD/methylene tetrahydromethanopterin reductase-like flavin-dependent oxidoreductase (luciferase family)